MDGADHLRQLAAEIVAQGDVEHWWQRYSAAYDALDLVGGIDQDTGVEVGQEIRAALSERTGRPIPDFHLGSRRGAGRRDRWQPPPRDLQGLRVRAAWAVLPEAMAAGSVDFVSSTDQESWLVCSGAGPAPWPQRSPTEVAPGQLGWRAGAPPVSPEAALFELVADDHGCRHELSSSSSGASNAGEKRERWDLRSRMEPTPSADASALVLHTPHGTITAPLRDPVPVTVGVATLDPPSSPVEHYLYDKLVSHAWLHLLDPDRTVAPLSSTSDALVAIDELAPDHPLVRATEAIDDAFRGADTAALPPDVGAALRTPTPEAKVGAVALGVVVDHPDAGPVGLEAVVGHPDRFALHFVQSGHPGSGVWGLTTTATDRAGRGYVARPEPLASPQEGALHFRPPLPADAMGLTVHLQGPTARLDVDIELTG